MSPGRRADTLGRRFRRCRLNVVGRHVVLVLWVLVVLFPIYWMVMTSFKDSGEWMSWPPHWVPHEPTTLNYRQILYFGSTEALRREATEQVFRIWKGAGDSLFIATVSSVFSLLLGSFMAYAISRFRAGGRNFPYAVLCIRMLPPIVIAVPFLIYYPLLGLFDSYVGLMLVYVATTLPFVIWMMLSFIEEVPKELEHAARLMGAGRIYTLRKVVFPLVSSGMVVTFLFVFILNWSEFLLALTLTQPKVVTLPVLLNKFQSAVEGRLYGPQAAIGTVITIPVVVVGILIQKHLVKGFSFGMIRK